MGGYRNAAVGVVLLAFLSGMAPRTFASFSSTAQNVGNVFEAADNFYVADVQADDPFLYWRLEETSGTEAADSAGHANPGLYRQPGTTLGQPGIPHGGSAVALAGSTTGYVAENRAEVLTVEVWFATTTTSGGKLIGYGNRDSVPSSAFDRHIYMTDSGQLIFGVRHANQSRTVTSAAAYNDGDWHLATASLGPGGIALYVDGTLVASDATITTTQDIAGVWRLGYDNLNEWPSRPSSDAFAGTLDEAAVYHHVLTPTQIAARYAAGTNCSADYPAEVLADDPRLYWRLGEDSGTAAADASGNDRPGVYNSGVTVGAAGALACTSDTAAVFDGTTNGYAFEPRTSGPQVFTVEVWFATTTTSGGKLIGFGDRAVGGSPNYDRHVYMTDSGQLVFGVHDGTERTVSSAAAYNDGAWHLATASLGPAGMALYVDGTLVASDPTVTTAQDIAGVWRLGYDSLDQWPMRPSSDAFAGVLDEAAVYHHVLSPAQVAAHYQRGVG